jgi:hypothetical protein
MIFYSWTALSGSKRTEGRESDRTAPPEGGPGAARSSVAMGITDDRGRAMKAGEELLGSGRAAVVIIEAVRPAMAARTLAPCYVRTGVAWLGRRTSADEVTWHRFFPADPGGSAGAGRMGT